MSFFDSLRKQKFLSFTLVLFTLAIGILIGTVMSTGVKAAKDQVAAPGATPLTVPNPVQLQNSFATIAKQVEPSVVNISTEFVDKQVTSSRRNPQRRRTPVPDPQGGDDEGSMQDFFQRFFGGPGGPSLEIPQGPQKQSSLGSGVVVDKNGYILTNNHVVEKATRIKIKFTTESTEYDAHVVGTDPLTDLAVVKVDKTNLTAAAIGNSDAIQVGDWAVAIGSPFGFNETMTVGIISAKERDIPGDSTSFQHFLQTDAAINPGNSGGPLLNLRGEVIGINTMIASRTGGNTGIGFAMPINTAVKVYNQIIKTGHVTRGSIGIRFPSENNSDLLKAYGAKMGVFVESVQPGGPAEKAGVKAEDIVTAVNGKTIKKGQDLIDEVAETPVGNSVAINLLRDGKQQTVNVTVGDRAKVFPEELGRNIEPKDEGAPGTTTSAKFGLSVQALAPGLKQNLGYNGTAGVLIDRVLPGSFAEDIGLRKNDVITSINRQPVNSIEDVQRIQKTLKTGESVAFRVMRSPGRGAEWQALYLAGELGNTQ